jgi:hypothetical protein
MGQSISQDENSTLLRELAERLLQMRFPGDSETPEETELLPGAVPASLPVEIPLPEGCRVVGSVARAQRGVTIVLDCAQPADEILAFYQERLTADGWTVPEMPHLQQGGFQHAFFANHATFCRGARGPALNVQATEVPDLPTDVRLDLQTDPRYSPCGQQHHMPMHGQQNLIPALMPPPRCQQQGGGAGGGGTSWHSDATLRTGLDLASLAAHYGSQLEKAGWTRTGAGQDGPVAWSTWTFHDADAEPWHGLFFILKRPDAERDHFLSVHVDADTDAGPQFGQSVRLLSSSGQYTIGR